MYTDCARERLGAITKGKLQRQIQGTQSVNNHNLNDSKMKTFVA